VLLVNDSQTKVLEFNAAANESMRANYEVDSALLQTAHHLGGAAADKHSLSLYIADAAMSLK
jgi:hypothetical protein